MKKYTFLLSIVFVVIFSSFSSEVSLAGESLGTCFTDALTSKDRKDLARWMFFTMAAHSELKEFSTVSEESHSKTNKYMGELVTRLLTEDCSKQMLKAIKENDKTAIDEACILLGEVAIKELMLDKEVNATGHAYMKFVDKEKLEKTFKTK